MAHAAESGHGAASPGSPQQGGSRRAMGEARCLRAGVRARMRARRRSCAQASTEQTGGASASAGACVRAAGEASRVRGAVGHVRQGPAC